MSKCNLHLADLRLWPNISVHAQPDHVRVPRIQEALADFSRTTLRVLFLQSLADLQILFLLFLRRLIPSSQGGEDGF